MAIKDKARGAARSNGAAPAAKRARRSDADEMESAMANTNGESSNSSKRLARSNGAASAELPMGKYLASTDKRVRDGAVRSIAQFLSRQDVEPLSDLDLQKLWKGIFYCFWMSDKPLVQQALAQELADLVFVIKSGDSSAPKDKQAADASGQIDTAMRFIEGFFDAMVREWNGLDKWRVPKFYLLIRRFLHATLRLLALHGWPHTATKKLGTMLSKPGGALCPNDVQVPSGVTYHICDIYIEELNKVASDSDGEKGGASTTQLPLATLLDPFVQLAAKTSSPIVYDRIMKGVIMPWLDALLDAQLAAVQEDDPNEGPNESSSLAALVDKSLKKARKNVDRGEEIDELRRATFADLFRAASQPGANEARRRRLYKLCKEEEERLEEESDWV